MNHDDTPRPQALPLPIVAAPDPAPAELAPLLDAPAARLWEETPPAAGALRERLLGRLAQSRAAAAGMVTRRGAARRAEAAAPGVAITPLYQAEPGRPRRAGEPLRARLVELAPGAAWHGPEAGVHREWLLLRGAATLAGEPLGERDYHVDPADAPAATLASDRGALVFLRESAEPVQPGDAGFTVRDAEAGWPEFAPGIRRRVLWQREGRAALLYLAAPGASVPRHDHGHDEECLMLQGELFLDDLLPRAGDYQLAPAGTGHALTETDTGAVIYAHGDLDLRFLP